MEQLKKYILSQVAEQKLSKDEAKVLLTELLESSESIQRDVAIIGMAGRFSSADNAESFWNLLRNGASGVRDFPIDRLRDIEHVMRNPHYTEFMLGSIIRPEDIPHINVRAGYMNEIDKFDAAFFGIPRTEATFMDPNQRVALEVAYEAMENAGYGGDCLVGSRTGVYIGRDETNYSFYRLSSDKDPLQLTGSWESMIVSRISYLFDFKGPSMIIDTACSAGLVSVHMAAQALIAGECDQAIAGGINLTTTGEIKPRYLGGANMENVESDDGRVKTFDAKANGTVWGEGAGLVLLKPLRRALEDGDYIHGIIKGSAINNDGATNSLTAPSAKTQEDVIVEAWKKAGIPPETITYVEAHGTGTVLGDPIEVKGLTSAFRRFSSRKQFCAIGSLKSNMGHMVAASGAASLIKVLKSMEHKELPPTINFEEPNPYINFMESPFYVNTSLKPWEAAESPRRAAISSFGFSRTNCHLVVEEGPHVESLPAKQPRYCLTISAKNEESMLEYVRRYEQFVERDSDSWNLADVCYTSNLGRGHYEHRAVIIASTKQELRQRVKELASRTGLADGLSHVYAGIHTIVSDKKKLLDAGELSVRTRNNLSELAMFKLKEYVNTGYADSQLLESVCQHYVEGAQIDWKLLYRDEARRRMPIPVYPLQRIRFWANPKVSKVQTHHADNLHPLVEREVLADKGQIWYETTFSANKQWVLTDHKIGNKTVLPGTSYLEMARFAAARALGSESLEFRDIFFLVPMVVEDGEELLARMILSPIASGFSFSVVSLDPTGSWTSHVEGKVYALAEASVPSGIDIEAFKSTAKEIYDPFIGEHDTGVFQFGPHWDTVRAVWGNDSDTLARLQLSVHLQGEIDIFPLHPSVMDNAVNLTSQNTGQTFLPFMYKKLKVYGPFTKEMYSFVRLQSDKAGKGETMTFDVDMIDTEGRLLAQVCDYSVKRVHDLNAIGNGDAPGSCLKLAWVPREKNEHTILREHMGMWALIATEGIRAQELQKAMQASGLEVVPLFLSTKPEGHALASTYRPDGAGISDLLSAAERHGATGLLFACDYTAEEQDLNLMTLSEKTFRNKRQLGVDALFQLCKCIVSRNSKWSGGLKVLVQDAGIVDETETKLSPLAAATAALGRVIGQEYGHLKADIVDVSCTTSPAQIVEELFSYQGAGLRALRQSGVYVEELKQEHIPVVANLPIAGEGAYVISGGLGGLGLAVASRLAEKGTAKVVLLGRKSLAGTSEWSRLSEAGSAQEQALYRQLLGLQSRLTSLEYISLNVGDSEEVAHLGAHLTTKYSHISGIFHAAGVAGAGFLMSKEDSKFDQVLQPKLDGTMNLLKLMPRDGSGFMALFSSITALTGGEGQGDYCAANAFLDALADAARLQKINVVSINWPSWKKVGMSVDFNVNNDANLFSHIDVSEGLNWLECLIVNPARRVIPASLNKALAAQLRAELPFRLAPELSNSLVAVHKQSSSNISMEHVKFKGASDSDITATQRAIGTIFAAVLGLSEIDIFASFQDMGGNSLMSTQLLKLIEEQFPGMVDISDLFSYPSISDLAEFIDSRSTPPAVLQSQAESNGLQGDDSLRELLEKELGGTEFLEIFLETSSGGGAK